MKKQPLTVAIMTRNEEGFIKHAVESALKVSDDVLVGDMKSTDKTVEIAESMGARVISVPPKLMVEQGWAAARNWINGKAVHDWVLSLDADETLTATGVDTLNSKEWPWDTDVIVTPSCKYKCMPGMTVKEARAMAHDDFPHRRMFNRRKVKWAGIVHEEPVWIHNNSNTHGAPHTNVVREHFTRLRTKPTDVWRWGVDAQLWIRAVNGKLPKAGVDKWWFDKFVPQNIVNLRKGALMFFDGYPEYKYLLHELYVPRTGVTIMQHDVIIKHAAQTTGPVVELGVDWGLTTKLFADRLGNRLIIGVDDWGAAYHEAYMPDGALNPDIKHNHVIELLKPYSNVHIIRQDVLKCGLAWEYDAPGFVFFDASRDYDGINKELEVWMPLLAESGIVVVHDANRPGVAKACKERFSSTLQFQEGMAIWRS